MCFFAIRCKRHVLNEAYCLHHYAWVLHFFCYFVILSFIVLNNTGLTLFSRRMHFVIEISSVIWLFTFHIVMLLRLNSWILYCLYKSGVAVVCCLFVCSHCIIIINLTVFKIEKGIPFRDNNIWGIKGKSIKSTTVQCNSKISLWKLQLKIPAIGCVFKETLVFYYLLFPCWPYL